MFQLFVIACVGLQACEYVAAPIAYPTETVCARQAALLAGMTRGRYGDLNGVDLKYEYTCTKTGTYDVAATAPVTPPEHPER